VYMAKRGGKPVVVKLFQLPYINADATVNAYYTEIRTQDFLYEALAQLIVMQAKETRQIRSIDVVSAHQYDMFVTQDFYGVIVYDYTTSTTLARYIRDPTLERDFTWRRNALLIIRSLASSMRDLHVAGIVHLDLKPQNLLVFASKMAFVIDLGLVCAEQKVLDVIMPLFDDLKRHLKTPLQRNLEKPEIPLFANVRSAILRVFNNPSFGNSEMQCLADHKPTEMYRNPDLEDKLTFLDAKRRDLFSIGVIAYELYKKQLFYDADVYTDLYRLKEHATESDGTTVRGIIEANPITDEPALSRLIQRCMQSQTEASPEYVLAEFIDSVRITP